MNDDDQEPTISISIAHRLLHLFKDDGMCLMQADNGKFLAKNCGVDDEGKNLRIEPIARILE